PDRVGSKGRDRTGGARLRMRSWPRAFEEVWVRRRWLGISAIGLLALGGGLAALDAWRLRWDWQQARRDLAAGKYAAALPRLIRLFKIQGRYEEARRLVREGWDRYPDRVGTLQELARLETDNPIKIEVVRPILRRAYAAAPDDDRIWLGWASLATRTGRFAVA